MNIKSNFVAKCSICGSTAKNESTFSTSRHIRSQGHQKALARQDGSLPSQSQTSGSGNNVILRRLSDLESQNKMIVERLLSLENQMRTSAPGESTTTFQKANSEIRAFLLRNLSKGRSVNVDRIAEKTKSYSWSVVAGIISEMVDEEIFDIAEASSTNKVLGRYGMIIRRR